MTEAEKRTKVVEIAMNEIGVTENPPNSNKVKYNDWIYNKQVQGSAYAWCGSFVSWVFDQAGINLGKIDVLRGFVGCPFAIKALNDPKKSWGKIVPKEHAEKGDIVFFDWGKDGVSDHVGIFIGRNEDGKTFTAIEGNTGIPKTNDPKEIHIANSNGGCVMRRGDRIYSSAIFVRPNCYNS